MTSKLYAYSETRNVPPMTNISLCYQVSFNFEPRLTIWPCVTQVLVYNWKLFHTDCTRFSFSGWWCLLLHKRDFNSFSGVYSVWPPWCLAGVEGVRLLWANIVVVSGSILRCHPGTSVHTKPLVHFKAEATLTDLLRIDSKLKKWSEHEN